MVTGHASFYCELDVLWYGGRPVAVEGKPRPLSLPVGGRGVPCNILQFLHQRPGAHEALLQERHDGRTLESSLSQGPPGASARLVVEGPPQEHGVDQFTPESRLLQCLQKRSVRHLEQRSVLVCVWKQMVTRFQSFRVHGI